MKSYDNESEIVNQKKQFIFEVEQTSDHVFPNEAYRYYVYIKNISEDTIDNFIIKIKNDSNVVFEIDSTEVETGFSLEKDEVKLYAFKAYCKEIGTHTVHFIGYGKGTQIIHRSIKIQCSREYISDELVHRIHFYNFTPYEDKYSMEASNFNSQVTQTIKTQKLPYKAKNQPFKLRKNINIENEESLSYLEQYFEAKNSNEHVYQYLGRENFSENALESYSGKSMSKIFEDINKNSKYFKGIFFRSGTNHLLNDFMRFDPNGFIYRAGLLSSEIYHTLGVLPTFDYMSDKLFRWDNNEEKILNLIPKKNTYNWGENVWVGRGWFVYRLPTEAYTKTEEYQNGIKNGTEKRKEKIGFFDILAEAEEFVSKEKRNDELIRNNNRSSLVKYYYEISESLYDYGVFFVNIPITKIPSNFYIPNHKNLMAIIERTKPVGTKAVINYIIEENFTNEVEFFPHFNKIQTDTFELESSLDNINIIEESFKKDEECEDLLIFSPERNVYCTDIETSSNVEFSVEIPNISVDTLFDSEVKNSLFILESEMDYKAKTLNNLLPLLYQNNYNEIAFKIKSPTHYALTLSNENNFSMNEYKQILLNENFVESLKLKITNRVAFDNQDIFTYFEIKDIYGKRHRMGVRHKQEYNMDYITYTYLNKNGKEFIRRDGYQNIESIGVLIENINNKKILIFTVEDKDNMLHYFHHIVLDDIISFYSAKKKENEEIPITKGVVMASNVLELPLEFEVPYIKEFETFTHNIIDGGFNWTQLFRLNENINSYSYIRNETREYITPTDIKLFYDNINIPETAIIEKLRLKLKGNSSSSLYNKIYIDKAFNTNYVLNEAKGYKRQLEPSQIECYQKINESNSYYQNKLEIAEKKEQESLIKIYTDLLNENTIFNEYVNPNINYIYDPNNYIPIKGDFWYEIYDFEELYHELNNISTMYLVIEGYNTNNEVDIHTQVLYDGEASSLKTKTIPSGYFREKIELSFPNKFLLEKLRVRFRFNDLTHEIKVFNTRLELKFSKKQNATPNFEFVNEIDIRTQQGIDLISEYCDASLLNNGIGICLSFDDLKPGGFYQINSAELDIIYQKTDMDMILTNRQYQDVFYKKNMSSISGKSTGYLSGSFYNDVITMSQYEDNIGIENNGFKLKEALYQMFETRDDNITGIEIFPYGFNGNPDSLIKLGLYENLGNTPGRLIKEIYIDGWVKANEDIRTLPSIKYNFNIKNLEINEKYWFKIEVVNPRENSYYLLKGINKTKAGFKLLTKENNNYINTLGELKFNIYSKNLSKSFNSLPAVQKYFDNPFISIGLHKQGSIIDLQVNKYRNNRDIPEGMSMGDLFDEECKLDVFKIIKTENGVQTELPTEEEEL